MRWGADSNFKINWRAVIGHLALFLGSLGLALFLGEVAVRWLRPGLIKADPILGHVARPIQDRDRNGFRNAEVLAQADLVALGDSQTEGNNATREEAWPQVLGRLVDRPVYQIALGGWGPAQAYHLFDRALAFKPRTIIFGFYFGNDLIETYNLVYQNNYWQNWRQDLKPPTVATATDAVNYRLILQSGLAPDSWQLKLLTVRAWIRRQSKLYELAGNVSRPWRERLNLAPDKLEKQDKVEDFARSRPDLAYFFDTEPIASLLSPSYRLDTVNLDDFRAKEGWRLTQKFLTAMNDRAREAGVSFVVAVIPTKEMVYLTHLRNEGSALPAVFTEYYATESELAATVANFCRSQQLTCVFVLPDLAAALSRGEVIYGRTMDGHPIPAGYRIIAEAISRALPPLNYVNDQRNNR